MARPYIHVNNNNKKEYTEPLFYVNLLYTSLLRPFANLHNFVIYALSFSVWTLHSAL